MIASTAPPFPFPSSGLMFPSTREKETLVTEFAFKTKPFDHQDRIWRETRDAREYGIFWEQGTGKSKLTIDTLAWQYAKGDIDGALVIAPSGVHANWTSDELPAHLHPMFSGPRYTWMTDKAGNVGAKKEFREFLNHRGGLPWLSMTYDAFKTDRGKKAAWEFMKKRRVGMILDESGRVKNPKAQITKMLVGEEGKKPSAGSFAVTRRILDGTPVPNNPLDVFEPVRFLSSVFWRQHRFSNFYVFSRYFGVWRKMKAPQGHTFEVCEGFRNLDELEVMLKQITTRVLKDDVLDLPPKLYNRHQFEMTPKQCRVYDQLREEYWTQVGDAEIFADLAIVRLLRLAQVTAGYLPVEDEDGDSVTMVPIDDVNPRLEAFSEMAKDMPHKCLVWARFRQDVDLIAERLNQLYKKGEVKGKAVVYHGGSSESELAEARDRLQNGTLDDAQFFVSTQAKGATGITLHAAKTAHPCRSTIYYNNTFRLDHRQQSEDRNHRAGMSKWAVNYTDMLALNRGLKTIDHYVLGSLLSKFNVAKQVTGDNMREWLS